MKKIRNFPPPSTTLEFSPKGTGINIEVSSDESTHTFRVDSYRKKIINGKYTGIDEPLNWDVEEVSSWINAFRNGNSLQVIVSANSNPTGRYGDVVLLQDISGETATLGVTQSAYVSDHWILHMNPDVNISGYFNGTYMGWESNREHTLDIYESSVLSLEVPRTVFLDFGILIWPTDVYGNGVPNWELVNNFYQMDYFTYSYLDSGSKIYLERTQLNQALPYSTVVEGSFYSSTTEGVPDNFMCDITITGIDMG